MWSKFHRPLRTCCRRAGWPRSLVVSGRGVLFSLEKKQQMQLPGLPPCQRNNVSLGSVGPCPSQVMTSQGHLIVPLHKRRRMAKTTRGTAVLPALLPPGARILAFTKRDIVPEASKPPSPGKRSHARGQSPRSSWVSAPHRWPPLPGNRGLAWEPTCWGHGQNQLLCVESKVSTMLEPEAYQRGTPGRSACISAGFGRGSARRGRLRVTSLTSRTVSLSACRAPRRGACGVSRPRAELPSIRWAPWALWWITGAPRPGGRWVPGGRARGPWAAPNGSCASEGSGRGVLSGRGPPRTLLME